MSLTEIDTDGAETAVQVRLLGIAPGLETPVDVTPAAQAGQPIVSLIVQAQPGLRFGKRYRLDLTDAILDLDPDFDGGPRPLVPYSTEFTTANLAAARSQGSFPTAGVVFQDGYAYLVESTFTHGTLKVYDVRDPARPEPVPSADRPIENRPIDVAARPRRLVVGTTVPARSLPSNLHVFDISRPDDPQWVGAASVSNGVLDGTLRRVVLRGNYAYGLVYRKGVQVVDLRQAEANVAATGGPSQPAYWSMRRALNTDGQGFGMDAIVATIPLPLNTQVQWYPHDLDVGDYVLDNRPQPLVVVGAEERLARTCPLLVGSALGARVESSTRLRTTGGQDLCPMLVALGRVAGRDVAVLGVAYGPLSDAANGYGVAVVDLADPRSPQLLGLTRLELPDLADLVLDGESALVSSASGGTEVVSLQSPDRPYPAGRIDNLSGRLTVGGEGTYLSSGGSYSSSPAGGLHVAGGTPCNLLDLREERLMLEVVRDPVDGTLCGGGDVLVFNVCEASHVTLRIDGRLESLSLDGQAAAPISELPLAPGLAQRERPLRHDRHRPRHREAVRAQRPEPGRHLGHGRAAGHDPEQAAQQAGAPGRPHVREGRRPLRRPRGAPGDRRQDPGPPPRPRADAHLLERRARRGRPCRGGLGLQLRRRREPDELRALQRQHGRRRRPGVPLLRRRPAFHAAARLPRPAQPPAGHGLRVRRQGGRASTTSASRWIRRSPRARGGSSAASSRTATASS